MSILINDRSKKNSQSLSQPPPLSQSQSQPLPQSQPPHLSQPPTLPPFEPFKSSLDLLRKSANIQVKCQQVNCQQVHCQHDCNSSLCPPPPPPSPPSLLIPTRSTSVRNLSGDLSDADQQSLSPLNDVHSNAYQSPTNSARSEPTIARRNKSTDTSKSADTSDSSTISSKNAAVFRQILSNQAFLSRQLQQVAKTMEVMATTINKKLDAEMFVIYSRIDKLAEATGCCESKVTETIDRNPIVQSQSVPTMNSDKSKQPDVKTKFTSTMNGSQPIKKGKATKRF